LTDTYIVRSERTEGRFDCPPGFSGLFGIYNEGPDVIEIRDISVFSAATSIGLNGNQSIPGGNFALTRISALTGGSTLAPLAEHDTNNATLSGVSLVLLPTTVTAIALLRTVPHLPGTWHQLGNPPPVLSRNSGIASGFDVSSALQFSRSRTGFQRVVLREGQGLSLDVGGQHDAFMFHVMAVVRDASNGQCHTFGGVAFWMGSINTPLVAIMNASGSGKTISVETLYVSPLGDTGIQAASLLAGVGARLIHMDRPILDGETLTPTAIDNTSPALTGVVVRRSFSIPLTQGRDQRAEVGASFSFGGSPGLGGSGTGTSDDVFQSSRPFLAQGYFRGTGIFPQRDTLGFCARTFHPGQPVFQAGSGAGIILRAREGLALASSFLPIWSNTFDIVRGTASQTYNVWDVVVIFTRTSGGGFPVTHSVPRGLHPIGEGVYG
jgi:hypothetical protein